MADKRMSFESRASHRSNQHSVIEQRLSNAIDMMNRNELKFRKSQSEGSSQIVSQGGVIERGS